MTGKGSSLESEKLLKLDLNVDIDSMVMSTALFTLLRVRFAATCDGFLAVGAGDPASNGCYTVHHGSGTYVLDAMHTLYAYSGVWRIGEVNVGLAYVATASSGGPPRLAAQWACANESVPGYPHGFSGKACPPPTLSSSEPPTPPRPLFPTPVTQSDRDVECAVKTSAWRFAQHTQPWRGVHLAVFDALELATRCNASRPAQRERRPARSFTTTATATTSFHIDALHGSDTSGNGTVAAPFASLPRGVQACRVATTAARSTCDLYLSDAAPFMLTQTLELTAADSGLTINPEPDAASAPIITSASPSAIHTPWSQVGANVWKAKLSKGYTEGTGGAVYIDGERAIVARWPNVVDPATALVPVGYVGAASWFPPTPRAPGIIIPQPNATRRFDKTFPNWFWGRENESAALPASERPLTFDPSEGYWMHPDPKGGTTWVVPSGLAYDAASFSPRAKSWANATTGRVHVFHGQYWGNWIFQIESHSHNLSTGTLGFGAGGWQEARGHSTGGAFFVENIREELDAPREYFIDDATSEVFVFLNESSSPPRVGRVAVASLEELITITGSAENPAVGIAFNGLTITGNQPSYLSKPFRAPSGGDWSFANTAAVIASGVRGLTINECEFRHLGGNGLLLRGWSRDAHIVNSTFDHVGDSGIVTCGDVELADLSSLTVPANTLIEGNIFSNVGVEIKQAGGLYSALSANHTVSRNLFFNGPRAGVNINDGAHGGHVFTENLFFNLVRETSDHGAFNSWDREPYIQVWNGSDTQTRTPAPSHLHKNFFINTHFGIHSLDHDDGSNAFIDTSNVVYAAGMKNFLGFHKNTDGNLFVRPDFVGLTWDAGEDAVMDAESSTSGGAPQIPLPRSFYFPFCVRSLGQASWGNALADTFRNNTCILNSTSSLTEFGTCLKTNPQESGDIPIASGNTYFVPGGNASISCGPRPRLTIPEAAAVGYEVGSTTRDSLALSPEGIVAMIEEWLAF